MLYANSWGIYIKKKNYSPLKPFLRKSQECRQIFFSSLCTSWKMMCISNNGGLVKINKIDSIRWSFVMPLRKDVDEFKGISEMVMIKGEKAALGLYIHPVLWYSWQFHEGVKQGVMFGWVGDSSQAGPGRRMPATWLEPRDPLDEMGEPVSRCEAGDLRHPLFLAGQRGPGWKDFYFKPTWRPKGRPWSQTTEFLPFYACLCSQPHGAPPHLKNSSR